MQAKKVGGYAYVLQWTKQTNLNFDINHKKW